MKELQIRTSALRQLQIARQFGFDPAYWTINAEAERAMLTAVREFSLHGGPAETGRITEYLGLPVSKTADQPYSIKLNSIPKGLIA